MNNPFESIETRLNSIESLLYKLSTTYTVPPVQNQAEVLLTVPEAAQFLTLSVATIYTLTSRGELPFMKRSKRNYFLKEDLVNYLKAGRSKTNKEIAAIAEGRQPKNK
jgi:excisionase family DNA binding protein